MIEDDGGDAGGFADLALAPELCQVLSGLGYEEPTPIQLAAIPPLLGGRDLVGQAATGTGKTAAFALPVLQRILREGERPEPLALVLVPTRELAVQVCEAMRNYGHGMSARVLPVYGGEPIGRQLGPLKRGVDVVVATPGRALDHIKRGTLKLSGLEIVVLDEADEMLDMGFAEEIEAILGSTPEKRQTALFSATMPPRIDGMVRRHLRDPVRVELGREASASADVLLVRQTAYLVPRGHKAAALSRVLDLERPTATIVFCPTRDKVDQLTESLNGRGHRAEALHGGMDQQHRDRVDGPSAQPGHRPSGSHRRGRTRSRHRPAHARGELRRAKRAGLVRASHRARWPGRPRRHRHHPARAARAQDAQYHRTGDQAADHDREAADRRQPACHAVGADARRTPGEPAQSGDLRAFQAVVGPLGAEFDLFEVALAAVKLAHEASGTPREEEEIPAVEMPSTDDRRDGRKAKPRDQRRGRRAATSTTRLFVGTGRSAGVRPQDLVGAITGESYLSGRDIGAIEIADRFSLVEVPESAADDVVAALRRTSIKGRSATVRRERYPAR